MIKKILICLLVTCVLICGVVMLASCNGHTHKLTKVSATEATCANEGNTDYYECECGKYFSDTAGTIEIEKDSWIIPTSAHSTKKVAATDATCSAEGNTAYYKCVCGKYFSDSKGTKEIKENSWVIPTIPHNLTKIDTVNATCEAMGNDGYYACECGKYFADAKAKQEIAENAWVITATGHTLVKVSATDATCDLSGNSEYYVCGCGKYFSDDTAETVIEKNSWVIPVLGHTVTLHEAVDATCTTAGNAEYYSCDCGSYFSDELAESKIKEGSWVISALGHSIETVRHKDATCAAEGNEKYYECRACESYFADVDSKNPIKKDSWILPIVAHEPTKVEAVAPECTVAGNSEYYACDCGKYFADADATTEIKKDSWVLPATRHTMRIYGASPATCLGYGNEAYNQCTNCNKYFKDLSGLNEIEKDSWKIAPIGHDYRISLETYDAEGKYAKKVACANNGNHVLTDLFVELSPEEFDKVVNDPTFVKDPTSTTTNRSWSDYRLSLNGDYETLSIAHAGYVGLIAQEPHQNGLTYDYYEFNRVIDNFIIDGNNSATVAGINLTNGGTHLSINEDKGGYTGLAYYADVTITIDTLVIKNLTLTEKLYIHDAIGGGRVKINNLIIENVKFDFEATQAALHIISEDCIAENITISGCNFEGVENSTHIILIDSRTTDDVNITVRNCIFEDFSNNAVQISGSGSAYTGNIKLIDNIISGAGDRVFRLTDLREEATLTITGNLMINSSDDNGEMVKVSSAAEGVTIIVNDNRWEAKDGCEAVVGVIVGSKENLVVPDENPRAY